MWLLPKKKKKSGWLAFGYQPEGICVAHVRRAPNGKPHVSFCMAAEEGAADAHALEHLAKELHAAKYHCTTLLRPSEYQMLLVDAPNAPPD